MLCVWSFEKVEADAEVGGEENSLALAMADSEDRGKGRIKKSKSGGDVLVQLRGYILMRGFRLSSLRCCSFGLFGDHNKAQPASYLR